MTSRDRVINTLLHQSYHPIPTMLAISPHVRQGREAACAGLDVQFQNDVDFLDYRHFPFETSRDHRDSWGCVWSCRDGAWACLEKTQFSDPLDIEGCRVPQPKIDENLIQHVNDLCENNKRFVVVRSAISPLRRLKALLGTDVAFEMIRKKPKELMNFLVRLHGYYLKQLDAWLQTDVDAVCFEDDWADERGLKTSYARWNEIFAPLYHDYCTRVRRSDKFVYFSSKGNFEEIIPNLIHMGVDAIRFECGAVDWSVLTQRYAGRIAFHAVLEEKTLLEETESDLSQKILSYRSFFENQGGLIAECRMPMEVSMRKIAFAMNNWRRRMPQPE
ncbi:MAG: uroporphyrinogen decarboxylase family protein [Planctomycetia bacterium]|nr:uroporphyrinogen decarboxylase family protein [Planctomycetia bacterium]